MLNGLQPWHLIILVLLVVLLFGAKRLPDAARSIGKSMKIFKAETKDLREDGTATEPDTKQITTSEGTTATASTGSTAGPADDQVAQLQRQLDELKRQQAAEKADQAHKHAS
ncbi:Sec-independent protein translocase subunit TatA [Amycolatopsis granulosa]|uniref:Sec-independent protein translocase subunit TatA n=1 Tax=Amycolatopsis granulosa TaxID=185684 RepID=UPI001420ED59|nr:Sec-independent protein translocase subunit TatA [Amycolatopsis granulosa]NIH83541.1 sec-independent protein translocase protein TatA [Amycolatopsis granulosa]